MHEPIHVTITRIRQEIGRGSVPTSDVLRLCEQTEELLGASIRMESALHEAIKEIEKVQAKMKKGI